MRALVLAAAIAAMWVSPVAAQDTEGARSINLYEQVAANNDLFSFDWGIPTSPALTLAGLADGKTPTSTSLKDFVVSLPTLMGGGQGQALALDVSAARLFGRRDAPNLFTEYASSDGYWRRLMYRTRIGAALYEGNDGGDDPGDAVASRLALGISASLLDDSDPLAHGLTRGGARPYIETCLNTQTEVINAELTRNYQVSGEFEQRQRRTALDRAAVQLAGGQESQARAILAEAGIAAPAASIGEFVAVQREEAPTREQLALRDQEAVSTALDRRGRPAVTECARAASERAELDRDLDIGVGALWRGEPGALNDFEEAGAAVWFGFRQPWGVRLQDPNFDADARDEEEADERQYWMVAASGRFSFDERVATGDDSTPEIEANVSEAWVGIERYHPDWRFAARYGYREIDAQEAVGAPFEQSGERYLVSAQFRLGDEESGLWLGLSYGDASGSVDTLDDETALITLSFSPPAAVDIGR